MSFGENIVELVSKTDAPLVQKASWWSRVPLGHIADILNGYPFASQQFNPERGAPIIRIRDVTSGKTETKYSGDIPEGYWIEAGDYIVGMDGDFNARVWNSERGLLNQRVCKISADRQFLDPSFLAYILPGYLKLINDHTPSVTVKHLSSRTLQETPIPLPPLSEQRRIVRKLDTLSVRSTTARTHLTTIEKLVERYKSGVLELAFSGALSADWRARNPESCVAVAQVRKTRSKERKLSQRKRVANLPEQKLPQVWEWVSPDEVADDQKYSIAIGPFGSNLVKSDYRPAGVRLVFVRDIRRGYFANEGAQFIDPEKAAELHQHIAGPGDILITKMGDPPGDTCIFPAGESPAVITADCIKLKPHSSLASPEYLNLCIQSRTVQAQIQEITKGVAQQKVSLDRFRQIALPVAPLDEQREIVRRIETAFAKIDRLAAEAAKALKLLGHLDQRILAKAFAGDLVPQDPTDEPAETLLERIREARAAAGKGKKRRTV